MNDCLPTKVMASTRLKIHRIVSFGDSRNHARKCTEPKLPLQNYDNKRNLTYSTPFLF